MKNDGNNCGIILLREADAILGADLEDVQDHNLLRKRYLLVILQDLIDDWHRDSGHP